MTIAALRRLLDEIDEQGGPHAARQNHLNLPDQPPHERTHKPMTTAPTAPTAPAPTVGANIPVVQLLKWGDEHPDTDVRDQAARARAALTGLRQRHTTDQGVAAITSEAEQLHKRLAELEARKAELSPAPKPKRRAKATPVDYPVAEVRAWARAQGLTAQASGRLPASIVAAWRQNASAA